MSFLNWGLGLVFGAILARKVGEHALENNIKLNKLFYLFHKAKKLKEFNF